MIRRGRVPQSRSSGTLQLFVVRPTQKPDQDDHCWTQNFNCEAKGRQQKIQEKLAELRKQMGRHQEALQLVMRFRKLGLLRAARLGKVGLCMFVCFLISKHIDRIFEYHISIRIGNV